MDVATLILRARSGLNKKTVYDSPGISPALTADAWPAAGGRCDCSGFVAWCLKTPRKLDDPFYKGVNGGWFETTGIYKDGTDPRGLFTKIDVPKIGAMVVYPDYKNAAGVHHEGHIGIVTATVAGTGGVAGVASAIHCSLGGWNDFGDAIRETPPTPWLAHSNSIVVWFDSLTA